MSTTIVSSTSFPEFIISLIERVNASSSSAELFDYFEIFTICLK